MSESESLVVLAPSGRRKGRRRWARPAAIVVSLLIVAGVLPALWFTDVLRPQALTGQQEPSVDAVPVTPAPRPEVLDQGAGAGTLPDPVWPSGGGVVTVDRAGVRVADLPVYLSPVRGSSPQVQVQVKARRSGGLSLELSNLDKESATVEVAVDYTGFAGAFGGGYADRLRLVTLECAAGSCTAAPVEPGADVVGRVTGQVMLPGDSTAPLTMALTAGASGSAGDFGATPLQASSTWSAGANSGGFTWQYPIAVPPGLNGPVPALALAYSSTAVDGRNQATNNQPGWVGEGFDLSVGFVERRYQACSGDQGNGSNNANKSGDLCWATDNAVVSLNGSGGELVKDDATGVWRFKNDDGSRIERLTDTVNGDNDNEYWKVTGPDGTQYFFGLNRLPGYTGTAPANKTTNSVWTVPVAGNHPGEPCHASGFIASFCDQAWRWNLDYVVDRHGNTMSYFYQTESNKYGRYNTPTDEVSYIRSGWLDHIVYGTDNRGGTDTVNTSVNPPMRVQFTVADRCLTDCWSGSTANAQNWPDTPWDLSCTATTCDGLSPSFWSSKRLVDITTQVWDATASAYQDVDSWALAHTFPDPGDGTRAGLWLESLTRTGKSAGPNVGGGSVTLPEINFDWVQMPNRVDSSTDGQYPMNWMRISGIWTETGGKIDVRYSDPECVAGSNMPASPQTNTMRCYPAKSEKYDGSIETDWFHKYVVTSVTVSDLTAGGPSIVTSYEYVGGVGWRHTDDDGLTPDKLRTWSDYRGYAQVKTRVGNPGHQTLTVSTFFRGLHGDLDGSGGTRTVTLPALDLNGDGDTTDEADAAATNDENTFAGRIRQTTVYNGLETQPVSTSVYQPWESAPTASRDMGQTTVHARYSGTTTMWSGVKLHPTGWRVTRADHTMDDYGMVTQTDDHGDVAVVGDERCTTTTYNRNVGANLLHLPSQETVTGLPCGVTPSTEAQLVADARLSYDGGVFGAAPTAGDLTRVEVAKSWSPVGGSVWLTQAQHTYDAYGRLTSSTDVRGVTTTHAYLPASGGPVTAASATSPLGTVTTTFDATRGNPVVSVDQNNRRTEAVVDALGRTTAVWAANRPRAAFPNAPTATFAYTIRNSGGANAVVTARLNAASTTSNAVYTTTHTLYDGLLRERQTQTASVANGQPGTVFTDTRYDDLGQAVMQSRYYDASVAPGTTLHTVADWVPKTQTRIEYDLAGRVTASAAYSAGVEQWRTTTTHLGDRINVVRPTGGGATTQVFNARGQLVETRIYHDPANVGSDVRSAYDLSTARYDHRGNTDLVTDNAGNTWSHTFDLLGRRVALDDPDKGLTSMTYNDAGDLLTSTDGRGQTLAYTYDSLGRRTGVYDGTVSPTTKLVTWAYDPPGNKGQVASTSRWLDGGTVEYRIRTRGYTPLYQSTGEDYIIPATAATTGLSGTYTFARTYRADGSLATSSYPAKGGLSAETVTIAYDSVTGLPERLQTNAGDGHYVFNTDYTVYGEPTFIEYKTNSGPWLQQALAYDDATRRLAQATTIRQTGPQAVSDVSYSYDDSGNIIGITTVDSAGATDTQCFDHDYAGRLTNAWTPASGDCATARSAEALGGPAPYWQSWTFDAAGNRATQVDHAPGGDLTTTYHRDSATSVHAVTSVAAGGVTRTYAHDLAGNTTCRPAGAAANACPAAADSQLLTWSPQGNLTSVSDSGGTSVYVYAADGTRLLADEPASVTLFLPGMEVRRAKADGTTTATRYYRWNDRVVASKATGGGLTWLVGDHQGTHQVAVNAGSQAITTRRQKPYGEARGGAVTWPTTKGFVGGTNDASGLVHIGARSYDPAIGSFISVDPIFDGTDPTTWTGYAYAGQTPITASDPSGLSKTGTPEPPTPPTTININGATLTIFPNGKTYFEGLSMPDDLGRAAMAIYNAYPGATSEQREAAVASAVLSACADLLGANSPSCQGRYAVVDTWQKYVEYVENAKQVQAMLEEAMNDTNTYSFCLSVSIGFGVSFCVGWDDNGDFGVGGEVSFGLQAGIDASFGVSSGSIAEQSTCEASGGFGPIEVSESGDVSVSVGLPMVPDLVGGLAPTATISCQNWHTTAEPLTKVMHIGPKVGGGGGRIGSGGGGGDGGGGAAVGGGAGGGGVWRIW